MTYRILAAFAISIATFAAYAAQPDWSDPQSVVRAATENSPALSGTQASLVAARERIDPAAAKPQPMLMAGVQNKPFDIRMDDMMTMYMVGVEQTFVRKGKLDARRTTATTERDRLEAQLAVDRAELERATLFAWYELAAADSKLAALAQVREAIAAVIDAARVGYEVGRGVQADVIRAQLLRSDLEHQIVAAQGARRVAAARLIALTGAAPQEIPPLQFPRSTTKLDLEGSAEPPESHPALVALRTQVSRAEQQLRLATLLKKPDVTVEASYGYRSMGDDMFSVVAKMELPIRRSTLIEPQIRAAAADREAAIQAVEQEHRALVLALGTALAVHEEATTQLEYHEQVLVPQAKLAFESTLTSYQSGKSTLDSVLAAESAYLRSQIDEYDFATRHMKAIVDYHAIMNGASRGAIDTVAALPSSSASAPSQGAQQMGGME